LKRISPNEGVPKLNFSFDFNKSKYITLVSLFMAPLPLLQAAEKSKPNILFIYTDDQGYGDMSALNPKSKIQTPNLD
jgi:hypothetical protein